MSADMLDAPEFKYTDRHIREDPDLRTWAEGYAKIYGGSFEPMLNAKRELRQLGRLETRTARVVLNCARYDNNFRDQIPQPKPPTLELVKTVATLAPFCDDPRPHHSHYKMEGEGRKRKMIDCPGVPWEINRSHFDTTVVVKAAFATAAQSNIYHRTSGRGWQTWYPPQHEMGPARIGRLVVDLICKYPSALQDPMLLKEEPTTLMSAIKRKPGFRTRCPNGCFES